MNIYVGNLSYDVTDAELQKAFSAFGGVKIAKVVADTYTGRSRGFGFVEMDSREQAEAAINELNGKDLLGRALVVNEARPKEQRAPRMGGGGGERRGNGGGNGGGNRRSNAW